MIAEELNREVLKVTRLKSRLMGHAYNLSIWESEEGEL